jgi:methyl-accepting chemotaxis protein
MKWFSNLKIGKRMIAGFLIVAAIAGLVGVMGIMNISRIADNSNQIYEKNTMGIDNIGKSALYYQRLRFNTLKLTTTDEKETQDGYIQKINDFSKQVDDYFAKYEQTVTSEEEQAKFDELTALFADYKKYVLNAVDLVQAGNTQQAVDIILGDATQVGDQLQADFDEFYALNENQAAEKNNLNMETQNQAVLIMIAIVCAGVAVAILLGVLIARSVSKPVNKMVAAADSLADGDLDFTLDIVSKDEVGNLSHSFGRMKASIERMIADSQMLVDAAVSGELKTRADENMHKGDYRKIVEGMNNTLNAVALPIAEASAHLERMADGEDLEVLDTEKYKGDFKLIINNLNRVRDSLYLLLGDSSMLVDAAAQGKLSTRADESRHNGGYRKIISGVNQTLDQVIGPLNEAAAVMGEMAKGNLHVQMEGDYKGDFAIIKDALNGTIRSMNQYISEISDVLGKMAAGDLTHEIVSGFKGDFVALKNSINQIVDALNEVLYEINIAADQVAEGTVQVSAGNQAVSQGASEQASSIEELTASVTMISEQTNQNAENSEKSNEAAIQAKAAAVAGNDKMTEMLRSMDEINESSANISKIIKVIDDIAFQTNILSLNAAVEAARAGVHGKGFAVVAEEVRNLAARSADAARETTEMIESSIKKVGVGTKLAKDTADALHAIVNNVEKAVELGEGIASASKEQALSITQINQGIEQMSQVVQNNSATAQEGAAASEELSGQAELLKEKIAQFRLRRQKTADAETKQDKALKQKMPDERMAQVFETDKY